MRVLLREATACMDERSGVENKRHAIVYYPAIGRYNMLITYVIGSVTAQVAWAKHTFASILVLLGNGERSFL